MMNLIKRTAICGTLLLALTVCGSTTNNTNNTTSSYPAPEAPQAVQAVAADGQVTVTWRPAANATSYNVYWKLSSGVTTSDNEIVNASSPYVQTGLADGTAYYYAATAVNGSGESSLSTEVSATLTASTAVPAAPANVQLTASNGQIVVSWDPVSGAQYYNVYWATTAGVTTASSRISASEMPFVHTGLADTTTYYYRVSAVNGRGESALSMEASAMARLKFSRMLQKVAAGDAQASDYFGCSVSIDGDYAIIGANSEDGGSGNPLTDAGAAYIFHRTGPATWDSGAKLVAPDAQTNGYFGTSVSISGDSVLVGAPYIAGGPENQVDLAGAAYLYRRSGTNTRDSGTKIVAPDAQWGDDFGISVALSDDYLIIGGDLVDAVANNAGGAYFY